MCCVEVVHSTPQQFSWKMMDMKNPVFSLCLLVQWPDPVCHCQTKADKNMVVSYCFYSCTIYLALLYARVI